MANEMQGKTQSVCFPLLFQILHLVKLKAKYLLNYPFSNISTLIFLYREQKITPTGRKVYRVLFKKTPMT